MSVQAVNIIGVIGKTGGFMRARVSLGGSAVGEIAGTENQDLDGVGLGTFDFSASLTFPSTPNGPVIADVRQTTAQTTVAFDHNGTQRARGQIGYCKSGILLDFADLDVAVSGVSGGSGNGGGGTGVGTGDTHVDHNTGGVDNLQYVYGSIGIDGADVRAYLTNDYVVGNRDSAYVKGQTETGPVDGLSGRIPVPMMLQSGNSYTIEFTGAGYETKAVVVVI